MATPPPASVRRRPSFHTSRLRPPTEPSAPGSFPAREESTAPQRGRQGTALRALARPEDLGVSNVPPVSRTLSGVGRGATTLTRTNCQLPGTSLIVEASLSLTWSWGPWEARERSWAPLLPGPPGAQPRRDVPRCWGPGAGPELGTAVGQAPWSCRPEESLRGGEGLPHLCVVHLQPSTAALGSEERGGENTGT